MKERVMVISGLFLFFIGLLSSSWGESKSIEFDFQKSFDMTLTTSVNEKEYYHGNTETAFKEIEALKGGSITLEADVFFKTIKKYGVISIGLFGDEKEEFLMKFYRGDREFLPKHGAVIPGARGEFSFHNKKGKKVHSTATISFNEKNRYLLTMKYVKEEYISITVKEQKEGETELQEVWNSGNLKITGDALFNKLVLSVRSGKGSKIAKISSPQGLYLKGVSYHPNTYMEAIIKNITITEE